MSVSSEKRTSDSNRWWMYDHRNSGILNGGLAGPGLNWVRFLPPFVGAAEEEDGGSGVAEAGNED